MNLSLEKSTGIHRWSWQRRSLIAALLLLNAGILPQPSLARPLQIIHTNDLHSHLDHASDPAMGGYAAVKATIDRLRTEAQDKGIDTLVLDAGDFSEGSQFYFADRGREVWRVMEQMHYDAVVLGNHDWLMGPEDMDRLLGEVSPGFPVVAANFLTPARFKNIKKYITPSVSFRKAGLRIAVLGLTTPEFVYAFLNDSGRISSHMEAGLKEVARIKHEHDAIIALTHIGIDADREIAKKLGGIDLIVGGHSHTTLVEPLKITSEKTGRKVPIVQTGRHGEAVGDLLVDIEPGRELKILRYQLVPVRNDDPGIADEGVIDAIKNARSRLERDYGSDWLYDPIAHSDVPLIPQENRNPTYWSQLVVDSMLEGGNADLALDVPEFTGIPHPPGPVSREALMQLYPRSFDTGQKLGWNIWTTEVTGWLLEFALKQALATDAIFGLGGVRWKESLSGGKRKISSIRIGGKEISPFKRYRLAIPEGIGRGVVEITPMLKILLHDSRDTQVPVWSAVEDKLRRLSGDHRSVFGRR